MTPLETTALGNRCYVASDGAVAVVIDPPRDIDRVLAMCGRIGALPQWVLETHVHNDYVSGGLELARLTGARYGIAAEERVSFPDDRVGLREGQVIAAGRMRIRAVHTPGHTDQHLSFVLADDREGPAQAVFTGGCWLPGTAGRTDLLGSDRALELARAQWRSIRRLAAELPDSAEIRPTHGFGSFCAAGLVSGPDESSVGTARATHPALRLDQESFVRELLGGFIDHPRYYSRMAPINRSGPDPIDLRPAPAAVRGELAERIAAGEWVVDLRPRGEFAAGHLRGSLNIEAGDSFATYLGWLLPAGMPVSLTAGDHRAVAAAQRAMALIGLARPAAQAVGPLSLWAGDGEVGGYPVARFADLESRRDAGAAPAVLDVRRSDEWAAGHLAGAVHLPLPDLAERLGEVAALAEAGPVWVHCELGFRASVAASALDAHGIPVVLVNDSLAAAHLAGMPLVRGG
ncbi:MAG TPA: MBL fold metallo-hydrolase [Candidatus Binatia bacterium]|nr:MBL fold metallo-hydrolase [Candidatus Binatia bacterium]